MRKIIRQAMREPRPPGMQHVTVNHEYDCRIWDTGVCTCNAEIEFIGRKTHERRAG